MLSPITGSISKCVILPRYTITNLSREEIIDDVPRESLAFNGITSYFSAFLLSEPFAKSLSGPLSKIFIVRLGDFLRFFGDGWSSSSTGSGSSGFIGCSPIFNFRCGSLRNVFLGNGIFLAGDFSYSR